MKPLFSQRHKSWIYDSAKRKKNSLSFESKLRVSLVSLLEKHSWHEGYEDNYHYRAEYTTIALNHMKLVLGESSFTREDVFTKEKYPNLELPGLVKIGYPSDVLDCAEAYLYCVENNDRQLFFDVQKKSMKY